MAVTVQPPPGRAAGAHAPCPLPVGGEWTTPCGKPKGETAELSLGLRGQKLGFPS